MPREPGKRLPRHRSVQQRTRKRTRTKARTTRRTAAMTTTATPPASASTMWRRRAPAKPAATPARRESSVAAEVLGRPGRMSRTEAAQAVSRGKLQGNHRHPWRQQQRPPPTLLTIGHAQNCWPFLNTNGVSTWPPPFKRTTSPCKTRGICLARAWRTSACPRGFALSC